ncbi:MAG: hypothetical protein KKE52_09360 [Alphaproteobacteria bacterium]|nr:hypothetical protein [Alphaproteobacteria bacterium]MBU2271492.1 hypothetical protein [Alphaproteobacteria bacterium]
MTCRLASAALAAFAVLGASCAPTVDTGVSGDSGAAAPGRQCFSTDQVRNFRDGEHGQLFIRAARDQVFELNTAGGCFDVSTANSLVILGDPPLAGSRICTGDWARIGVPGSSAGGVCRARVERMLTAEQVAALPSVHRP